MAQARTTPLFLALALALPSILPAQDAETAATEEAAVFVQTMIVPDPDQSVTRQFFGQVAALDTVDISFEVGGYLEFLEAREGAVVPEGSLLAQLDLSPFERAVERAELNLAQAERDLARATTLAERNVSSEVRAENAETARALADVALREAREALADARIEAPFDALVANRLGTPFTTIEPGRPILRLHNMSEVRVEFELPERLFEFIDDPVDVTFTGRIAGNETDIPLTFREFRAETTGIGQSYQISLAAAPKIGPALFPGRSIIVVAEIAQAQDGVRLPASAIISRPDGTLSAAVVAQGSGAVTVRHVPVEVASEDGTSFSVTGLEPGTEIVAIGAHLISDGQTVKRFTGLTVEGS